MLVDMDIYIYVYIFKQRSQSIEKLPSTYNFNTSSIWQKWAASSQMLHYKPCTPTKLSKCQTEYSVESKKIMKLSKEPYTFNVHPREMVKIMNASEKKKSI